MTASATAPTRKKAERAREDREYVRSLLILRQPQLDAALEAEVRKLLLDHELSSASSQRISQPGRARPPGTTAVTAAKDTNDSADPDGNSRS